MPASPARIAAFEILTRIDRENSYASELLHSSQFQKLSFQDHGLATELVMGVLRWRSVLDAEISRASDQELGKLDSEVLIALRLGVFQLRFSQRIPARAAIHESVELVKRFRKRSAAAFVNAVLRKVSRHDTPPGKTEKSGDNSELAEISISGHPLWLVERWANEYGVEISRKTCEYDQSVPETSIRLNGAAEDRLSLEAELEREGITLAPGKILASARRVLAGHITGTTSFRKRRINIQDESSQLVALLAGRGSSILDCCAAPGGKTIILAERNLQVMVVALDLHPHRTRVLRRLVSAPNVQVVTADALHIPTKTLFERVLVDAPCSGTGTLARHPEIKWRLKPEDIITLQAKQIAILRSAMKQVTRGGRLIYSTCSLEREENSAVVEAALAARESFRVIDCGEVLDELRSEGEITLTEIESLVAGKYLRTIPGVHACDGFFAAILERD